MIELRNVPIDFLNKNNTENILLGIGSEHCSIEFIKEAEAFLNANYHKKQAFRLITPKTDQNHISKIIELIEKIIDQRKPESIVINDLGILYYLKEKKENIVLGRILINSLGYQAKLNSIIHPEESQSVVTNMLAPIIIHSKKVELYKKYGVTAIELCAMPHEEEYFQVLKKYGFKIHMHYASFIAGLSKVCYNKKMENSNRESCSFTCLNPKKLNFASQSGEFNHYETLKKKQTDWPNFYLAGNIIYYINSDKPINLERYDSVIYDYRYCNPFDI